MSKPLRRAAAISGQERDALLADIRRILLTYQIGPGTLANLIPIAVREMRP